MSFADRLTDWRKDTLVVVVGPQTSTVRFNPNHDPGTGQFSSGLGTSAPSGSGASASAVKWSSMEMRFDRETPQIALKPVNGVPFSAWDAPKSTEEWGRVAGQNPDIKTPAWPAGDGRRSTGAIILEPDGRVWLVEPANHFGGYEHTFPKGGLEPGINEQATAIKEVYEETGLQVRITGHFADQKRTTSTTRYFFAERVGGTPTQFGDETQAVKLVPIPRLDEFLNTDLDKALLAKLKMAVPDPGMVSFYVAPKTDRSFIRQGNPYHDPATGQFTSGPVAGTESLDVVYGKVVAAKAEVSGAMGTDKIEEKINAWHAAKQAYKNHPDNPEHVHPDEHGSLAIAKAKMDAAEVAANNASNEASIEANKKYEIAKAAYETHPDHPSKTSGTFDEAQTHAEKSWTATEHRLDYAEAQMNTMHDKYQAALEESPEEKIAKAEWEQAEQKYHDALQAYQSHPDNPANIPAEGSLKAAEKAKEIAQKKYDEKSQKVLAEYFVGDVEKLKTAQEEEEAAGKELNAAKTAVAEHPDNNTLDALKQKFKTAQKEYQAALDAEFTAGTGTSVETNAASTKLGAAQKAYYAHPDNPKNNTYEALKERRDAALAEHDKAVESYDELMKSMNNGTATMDEVAAADAKKDELFDKYWELKDKAEQHPDSPESIQAAEEQQQQDDQYDEDTYGDSSNSDPYDFTPTKTERAYCPSCEGSAKAIRTYTTGHEGHSHVDINGYLRSPDDYPSYVSNELQDLADDIDSAIDSTKPLTEPTVVYRGANVKRLGYDDTSNLEGEVFTDPGFTSASDSRDKAATFGSASGSGYHVLFKTTLPAGMKMLKVDETGVPNDNEGEREVLLPRGGTFEIGRLVEHASPGWGTMHIPVYEAIYHPAEENWKLPTHKQMDLFEARRMAMWALRHLSPDTV